MLWFKRDEDGYFLLNYRTPSISRDLRAHIVDNYWVSVGTPVDLVSPPSGRILQVEYENGDFFKVEFFNIDSRDGFVERYGGGCRWSENMDMPITAVEGQLEIGGTDIRFGARSTTFQGGMISNCFFSGCGCGIMLN